jgi:hypothetical protein
MRYPRMTDGGKNNETKAHWDKNSRSSMKRVWAKEVDLIWEMLWIRTYEALMRNVNDKVKAYCLYIKVRKPITNSTKLEQDNMG